MNNERVNRWSGRGKCVSHAKEKRYTFIQSARCTHTNEGNDNLIDPKVK